MVYRMIGNQAKSWRRFDRMSMLHPAPRRLGEKPEQAPYHTQSRVKA
jgi:hypothetical protein